MSEIFSKILKDKNGKVLNVGSKYQQPEWGVEENVVIFPEATLTIDEDAGAAVLTAPIGLESGKVYTVNFNGTDYECTAVAENIEGIPTVLLGNAAALGGTDTSEPFFIAEHPEWVAKVQGYYALCVALDGSATPTMSIKGDYIHKLSSQYVGIETSHLLVNATGSADASIEFDTPFLDVYIALTYGRQVYAVFEGNTGGVNANVIDWNDAYITFAWFDALKHISGNGAALNVITYSNDGTAKWTKHTLP